MREHKLSLLQCKMNNREGGNIID